MILALATGAGLQKTIEQKVIGFNGHVQIFSYQGKSQFDESPIERQSDWHKTVLEIPNVHSIQAVAHKTSIVRSAAQFEGAILKGVTDDYQFDFFASHLRAGVIPSFNAEAYNDSILISTKMAAVLEVNLGDTLNLFFLREAPKPPLQRSLIISGLFNTGLDDFDKNILIGDLKHIQRLNNWNNNETGSFEIILKDIHKMEATAKTIRAAIPFDLDAVTVKESNEQIFQWLALFDINIIIIIIIVLIVASINTVVAMLILILESTQNIGLLKALGANNRQLSKIFLGRALHMIAKGLFWGNLIGLGLCFAQEQFQFIKLNPDVYYVEAIAIYLNPIHIIVLNVGTILFSLLILLLPVRIISKIAPSKAIRFQ